MEKGQVKQRIAELSDLVDKIQAAAPDVQAAVDELRAKLVEIAAEADVEPDDEVEDA